MRRFGMATVLLALAACSAERSETVASNPLRATAAPLRCEGLSGIEKLALESKSDLVGFAGGRAFLRNATKCESAALDGTDKKPCPTPDAKTVATTLLGEDARYLYFQGVDADGDVLFRASRADGTAKALFRGKASAKLAGDRLIWSDGVALWSIPTEGGTPKKLFTGSVADFAVNGGEIMVAGSDGVRLLGDAERAAPLVTEHVDAIAFSDKTIALRQADTFSTIDRATKTSKKLWKVPANVKAAGLGLERDAILTYLTQASKPGSREQAYVRIASDKPAALIKSDGRVANVTHHDGSVIWSIDDHYFRVDEASFGKATITCGTPQSAPVGDAGADAASEAGAKDGANDAGTQAPEPPPGDDDDIETSTDPTEPAGDPGSTVVIHPACSSIPGTTGSSSGVVLGLALLALRRRRRRR